MGFERNQEADPLTSGLTLARLLEAPAFRHSLVADSLDRSREVYDARAIEESKRLILLGANGEAVAHVSSPDSSPSPDIAMPTPGWLLSATEAVFSGLASQSRAVLQRSVSVLRSLTQAELAGADLNDITRILSDLVANPVIVKDPSHHVLAWSGNPQQFDSARESTIEAGAVTDAVLAVLEERGVWDKLRYGQKPIRVEADTEVGLVARVVCPIHAGGVNLGYVSISEGGRQLDGLDLLAVENAATVVGLHLAHQRSLLDAVATRKAFLLYELLFSDTHRYDEAEHGSTLLGLDLDRGFTVLALRTSCPSDSEGLQPAMSSVLSTLNVLLQRLAPDVVGIAEGTSLLAVVPGQSVQESSDLADHIVRELSDHHPSIHFAGGISRPCVGVAGLRASYDEAHLAARLGEDLHGPASVTSYAALGGLNLLGDLDPASIGRYVDATLGTDEKFRVEFAETYGALIDASFNKAEAARRLYVHVNTVQYRVKKIAQVTGHDPEDPGGRFTLECALRLLALSNARQSEPNGGRHP